MKVQSKQNTMDFVKRNLNIMHLTILLSMVVTFAIVVRFLYGYISYLPLLSLMVFFASLAVMSGAVFGLSRVTVGKALEALDAYDTRLNAFLDASRNMHDVVHSDLLIEKILDAAISLTGADGGALLMAGDYEIEFRFVRGANADSLQGMRIPRGRGIAGAVIEQGTPIRIDDARNDNRHFVNIDEKTGYVTRSILCVPLVVNGKRTGALELVKSEAGYFNADDENMLKYFVEQATIAVRDSDFREDMKNLESRLTSLLVSVNEERTGKRGHARMTAKYSLMIGREVGLSEEDLQILYRASRLHDIGMLRMDQPVPETEREYYAHAIRGYEILRTMPFYNDISSIVLHHHERYDGTGYPHGVKGEMIPLASRIISIAERFDVITNSKNSAGHETTSRVPDTVETSAEIAIVELRANAGEYYDPHLVDLFIKIIVREGIDESAVIPYCNQYAMLRTA